MKPARLIYKIDNPTPQPFPENIESGIQGPPAAAEQVKNVISDAKNEVVKFVKENGLNFSEEYYDNMGAELNVNEIYNQLAESHQFGVEQYVGDVAQAFVDYVNTLRTYHQHVKAGKQFSIDMLSNLQTSTEAFSKNDAPLHDPLAGLGLIQDQETGLHTEQGPKNTLLAKRKTPTEVVPSSQQATAEQAVAEKAQPVETPEEKATRLAEAKEKTKEGLVMAAVENIARAGGELTQPMLDALRTYKTGESPLRVDLKIKGNPVTIFVERTAEGFAALGVRTNEEQLLAGEATTWNLAPFNYRHSFNAEDDNDPNVPLKNVEEYVAMIKAEDLPAEELA